MFLLSLFVSLTLIIVVHYFLQKISDEFSDEGGGGWSSSSWWTIGDKCGGGGGGGGNRSGGCGKASKKIDYVARWKKSYTDAIDSLVDKRTFAHRRHEDASMRLAQLMEDELTAIVMRHNDHHDHDHDHDDRGD